MDICRQVEHSLHKKFSKTIWSRFVAAIKQFEMISPNDRIAVCISGGKDSMLLAKLMQQLHKVSDFPFEVKFLVMDPGYLPENRALIEQNAASMNIPITVVENNIFNVVYNEPKNPCYLCSRMRRGTLYSAAKALGCNKIALGHHFDDMIETVLMSIIYGSQVRTMMPKLHSDNFEGMELIRPLYLVRESEIIRWKEYNGLRFLQCACRFTEASEKHEDLSKRREIKGIIAQLEKANSQIPYNIYQSMLNVKLDNVIKYKHHGVEHSFLEDYDRPLDENARLERLAQLVEQQALTPHEAAELIRAAKR